ncbi:helix-hairpin-helix domain-containing protein [Galbibacter sp. EGI 63066]|uniref:ComEA family DNA-binding protein n=1 Tax=Galbibacter sp. EGI 63066 TaxID=2993559 RepID=UPI0022497923|nr:helix-hairpin-helix domain-containing protein [Galbibacter sp. EGI 63066]MCX2679707.1 helix-hairpin-helix domain-containing protein [Galbibacter sp. EGI 63066]
MKSIKSHFVFNKQERNGIFFLLFLIVVFQSACFFIDFSDVPEEKLLALQKQEDIYKKNIETKHSDTLKIYPFNPNYLNDFKGYVLGMNIKEIDKLLTYRAENKYVNSTGEFQEITGVSDSLLQIISPYFKFPKRKKFVHNYTPKNEVVEKRDLNTATLEDLKVVYGIGDKLSERIVKYRTLLGGFSVDGQLNEVYGLSEETIAMVLKQFGIKEPPKIEKLNVNKASLKQLSRLPYIDYAIAEKIVSYRTDRLKIDSIEQLAKIQGFPDEKLNRIQLYLTTD